MLRLVLGQSMRPVVLGMALGMALTAGVSRVLNALLFGVSALDPVVFASVSVFLAVVALLRQLRPGATSDQSRSNGCLGMRMRPSGCRLRMLNRPHFHPGAAAPKGTVAEGHRNGRPSTR